MGSRGGRVSREKRKKIVHRIEDWPIRPRRAGAALFALVAVRSGVLLGVRMEGEFDRVGEAVRTQERQWSIIVDKVFIAVTWWRIVPEDGRTVMDRIFPSSRPPGRRARDLTPQNDKVGHHVR
jgi:hypothetical protein